VADKKQVPKGHWQDNINRKVFFCKFAEENGFDPFVRENWANISASQILAKPVHIYTLLQHKYLYLSFVISITRFYFCFYL